VSHRRRCGGGGNSGAASLDHAAPPGASYDKAEFRLWLPDGGLGHEVGRSSDFAAIFFEEMMALHPPGMRPLSENSGCVGDSKAPNVPTAWLPNERAALAWQAVAGGRPFEP